jgi:hypothetical protein
MHIRSRRRVTRKKARARRKRKKKTTAVKMSSIIMGINVMVIIPQVITSRNPQKKTRV